MTPSITIGSVDVLADRFSGWSYPQFGTLVRILSDGTTVDNEVLQAGATPHLRAQLSGMLESDADFDTLTGYAASKEEVAWTDDDDHRTVIVLHFSGRRLFPDIWTCELQLMHMAFTS